MEIQLIFSDIFVLERRAARRGWRGGERCSQSKGIRLAVGMGTEGVLRCKNGAAGKVRVLEPGPPAGGPDPPLRLPVTQGLGIGVSDEPGGPLCSGWSSVGPCLFRPRRETGKQSPKPGGRGGGRFCRGRCSCLLRVRDPLGTWKSKCTRKQPGRQLLCLRGHLAGLQREIR